MTATSSIESEPDVADVAIKAAHRSAVGGDRDASVAPHIELLAETTGR